MVKKEFYIYQEDLIKYELKEEFLTISKLVVNLNVKYCESDMKKLRTETITDFLLMKGYLYLDKDTYKKPTLKGKILGITRGEISDKEGNKYSVNLYNLRAQKYIIDNIYDILYMKE